MHTQHWSNRRRALSRLMRADEVGLLSLPVHWADGGEAGGGTGTPAPTPDPAAKPPEKSAARKVELTEEDLQARIDAALAEDRRKAEAKVKREREEADAKAAKEQGKWQEIAQKAEARLAELSEKDHKRGIQDRIGEYLGQHHADYKGTERYILPLVLEQVNAETAPEDVTKAVKAAAEQYVKDNPRAAKAAGTPGVPAGRVPPGTPRTKGGEGANGGPMKFTGAAARF